MAIFHMAVRSGTRKGGQQARSAATYILRTDQYSDDSDEVLYATSGHMPNFAATESLAYWDAADTYERVNGRLYKSVECALPVALDDLQRRDLAVSFANKLTDDENLPYTLAIHAGKGHNPHFHLIISERRNDGVQRPADLWFRRHNPKEVDRGGAKKTTTLRPREWLWGVREIWANLTNLFLERAGHTERIDHRTLDAQGIDRKPGVHLGPALSKLKAKGIDFKPEDDPAKIEIKIDWDATEPSVPLSEPALLAPDILAPKPSSWLQPALRPSSPRSSAARDKVPEKERRAPQQDRTAQAVQRQTAVMGCDHYDVGIQHATGELDEHRWTLQILLENLQRLKHLNAQGRNILIRPSFHPLPGMVLVDGLSLDSVERMRADGYEPTATIETAPNRHQVWVRVGEHITKSRRDDIARYLAERYGGDVDAASANSYGRLAGFTSGESLAGGRRPFVTIKQSDSSGKIASGAEELLKVTLEARKQRPEDGPAPGQSDSGAG